MLKAIRNKWLLGWPGLTATAVNQFFPDSSATAKGHMKQQRQGVRSTKPKPVQSTEGEVTEDRQTMSILTTAAQKKQKDIYVKVWDAQDKVYTDQSGKFPVQSSKGHKYVMVMVEVDANYIDVEPMKNRTEAELI